MFNCLRLWALGASMTVVLVSPAQVGLTSINVDVKTEAAMSAALVSEFEREQSNLDKINEIFDHYKSAEVAAAGIFASKWLDRRALKATGILTESGGGNGNLGNITLGNANENYYYRRIYRLVSSQIMPKILDVAVLMIRRPDLALYWAPYLYKTTEEVRLLCAEFEHIVTNGRLGFQDVVFLTLNNSLANLYDLKHFGGVDWVNVWKSLSDAPAHLTREDIAEDLRKFLEQGRGIASAGMHGIMERMMEDGSEVGKALKGSPMEILGNINTIRSIYDTWSDPGNIKSMVLGTIGTTSPEGVARLFMTADYNISDFIYNYVNSASKKYYKQLWAITYQESGVSASTTYSGPSSQPYPYPYRLTYAEQDWLLTYTLRYLNLDETGLNRRNVEWTSEEPYHSEYRQIYYIRPRLKSYSSGGYFDQQRQMNMWTYTTFSYDIDLYYTWERKEIAYQEIFDSGRETEETFQARFNAHLAELQANEDGKVYEVVKYDKMEYEMADESQMKSVSSATFNLDCNDQAKLAEGNFTWKENASHDHGLNEDSKKFAMKTSLADDGELNKLDQKIAGVQQELNQVNNAINEKNSAIETNLNWISQNEAAENRCYSKANGPERANMSSSEIRLLYREAEQYAAAAARQRARVQTLRTELSSLESQKGPLQQQLNDYQSLRPQIAADYEGEDEYRRIPAVLREVQDAFGVQWEDDGRWQGFTFVRNGVMSKYQNSTCVFKAELTQKRKESHFLGIRIHRAILAVSWSVEANVSSTQVADVMEIDPRMPEAEKAKMVNDRIAELQEEFPECGVTVDYTYSDPAEIGKDDDELNLLWMSNRIDVASRIDYRLTNIYNELVMIEKYLQVRESLLDYIVNVSGLAPLLDGRVRYIGDKSFLNWRRVAAGVHYGRSKDDIVDESMKEAGYVKEGDKWVLP